MKVIHDNLFSQIISIENIFDSWNGFKKGKRKKADVQEFELHLEDGLFSLHDELKSKTYKHSNYTSFFINDPKRRHIHKACVRDRIVHHAIYRILYPIFDKSFIHDSYSCRNEKGTHQAINRLESFVRQVSKNYSQSCYYLKCDVRKFFDSIDHDVLIGLIQKKISDKETIALIKNILESFDKPRERERERERVKKIALRTGRACRLAISHHNYSPTSI